MPITSLEIKDKTFSTRFRGFDQEEVDEFLDIVVRDYEDLVRSNHDKDLHIKSLEERLSYFDEMKDSLSQSVLIAQDTAERVKHAATERPFQNEYFATFEEGIYVDVTTGEPLFFAGDKFDSGCGWPSFTRPIAKDVIKYYQDKSHGMERIEVRSRSGNAHLGHVFTDGPQDQGGLRYCINSAALRFIKKEEMEETGYGYLLSYMR